MMVSAQYAKEHDLHEKEENEDEKPTKIPVSTI